MEIEIKPLHYGHSDGHTDITYSTDGERLISCGGDGDLRIWNGFDDDDPFQTCLGEFVLCAKHKNDHLIVGADNSKVQLVQFPSGDRDGILTRFTAQVNHISTNNAHNWVAIGSEDMTLEVINFQTKEVKSFAPLKGPVLSIAIDNSHQHIAASCGDGSLQIIAINNQSTIKQFPVVPKANSLENAEVLCRTDFDRQSKYFAYPDSQQIVVLNIVDWSEAFSLNTDKITSAFSIVAFSPDGNYIAGSTIEGDIIVWNVQTQTVCGFLKHPKDIAITAMCWNPKENGELAFSDIEGYIGLALNCCNSMSTICNENKTSKIDNQDEIDVARIDDDFLAAFADEDDDADNENAVSLEKLKRDVMGVAGDQEQDRKSVRSRSGSRSGSRSPRRRSPTPEPPLQAAFMPSSTPEHLDPRYMCWNEVGVIRSYGAGLEEGEEGPRSIEVEFHDFTLHNSMMLANYNGYTMGSISSAALAVANANSINVVPLGSSTKEWTLNVPEEDVEIIAVATSHNLICFGTTRHLVHICTIYGIQKAVLSVPGPIITMSAFGHVLLIAYHAGTWRKGDQCVDIMLVKLEGTSIESRYIKSALTPESCVQWLGFTDVGTPGIMDSTGMLFLHPLQANIWLPFCNTRKDFKSPSDYFFVTAVYESLGAVRGIKCKGSQYPGFTPAPTLTEVELLPPFWNTETEKHQLEANLYTWSTLQIENTEKKIKENALKAFALSAKNNFDQRALELMEMLGNPAILNLGIKYVNKLEKRRLADKLIELATKLTSENDPEDFLEMSSVSTPGNTPSVIKPNRKLSLTSGGKIASRNRWLSTPKNSPSQTTVTQQSISTPLSSITQQDLTILNEEPKNPFLKSLKKGKPETYNPLSLTDKFAGVEDVDKQKENKSVAGSEKRKSDSSPAEKGKHKQRKLDKFLFSTKQT